jgi:hypothetical protein
MQHVECVRHCASGVSPALCSVLMYALSARLPVPTDVTLVLSHDLACSGAIHAPGPFNRQPKRANAMIMMLAVFVSTAAPLRHPD